MALGFAEYADLDGLGLAALIRGGAVSEREVMETAGFTDLKRMPVDHQYFPTPVPWQAGWEGVKP